MRKTSLWWWMIASAGCAPAPIATIPLAARPPIVAPELAKPAPKAPPEVAPPEAAPPEQPSAEEAPAELPATCASNEAGVCVPPAEFARRLCKSSTPDLALSLFAKGTPWTRAYVRGDMEAWYVSAGRRTSPKELRYAEEVLIVARRGQPSGGVQLSGFDSYDVYRWDGTCVSLMVGEVSLRPPGTPDVAPIVWKRLEPEVQEALETSKKIAFRNQKRREACRGDDPDRCERAVEGLSRIIAEHVRGGGRVPLPRRLP